MAIMGNLVTRFFMSLDPTSPTLMRKGKNLDSPDYQPVVKVKVFDLIDEEVPDCIKERFFKGSCTFCGVVKKKGVVQGVCFSCRSKAFRKSRRVLKSKVVKIVEQEEKINVETQNDKSDGAVIVEEGDDDINVEVESSDVLTEEDDKENVESYCVEEDKKDIENESETEEDIPDMEIVDELVTECEIDESAATDNIIEEEKHELEEHEIITEIEKHEIVEGSPEATQENGEIIFEDSGALIEKSEEDTSSEEIDQTTEISEKLEDSEEILKEESNETSTDKIKDETQKQFLHNLLLSAIEKVNILERVKRFGSKINIFEDKSEEILDNTEAAEETQTSNVEEKDFLHNFPVSAMEEVSKLKEPGTYLNTLKSYEEKFDKMEQSAKDSESMSRDENNEITTEPIIEEPDLLSPINDDEPLIKEPDSLCTDAEGSSSSTCTVEITEEIDEVEDESNDNQTGSENSKFDTLVLRNRNVTETLSPICEEDNEEISNEDDGCTAKVEFDTLVLRNRNITETLSPIHEDKEQETSNENDGSNSKVTEKSDEDITFILDDMQKDIITKKISRKRTTGSSSSRQPQRESRGSKRTKTNKSN